MAKRVKVCFKTKTGERQFLAAYTRQTRGSDSACRYKTKTSSRNYGISGRSRAS